jgi:hypothetical protein
MSTYAIVDTADTPGTVVQLAVHDSGVASYPNPANPHFEWVDVTAVSPQPQVGWTYDGTTFTPSIAEQDFSGAVGVNDAYLALIDPTSQQVTDQVTALTHQVNSLLHDVQAPPPPVELPLPSGERRIDSITPNVGPKAGGTTITLSGSGFTNIGGVRFEGSSGTAWAYSFEVIDDQHMTCPTPPGTGTVDVIAFDGDPGDAILAGGFTYG